MNIGEIAAGDTVFEIVGNAETRVKDRRRQSGLCDVHGDPQRVFVKLLRFFRGIPSDSPQDIAVQRDDAVDLSGDCLA